MNTPTVGIVDVGIANIGSISRIISDLKVDVEHVRTAESLREIDRLIFPGVGAFPAAMACLELAGLNDAIRQFAKVKQYPVLGICLGMQLLASVGEEFVVTSGLGLVEGHVQKMKESSSIRLPHIGWNEVVIQNESPLFEGIPDHSDFYFVHSYSFKPTSPESWIATTTYGDQFCSAIQSGNVMGVQFHPEKSSSLGRLLLKNFCKGPLC